MEHSLLRTPSELILNSDLLNGVLEGLSEVRHAILVGDFVENSGHYLGKLASTLDRALRREPALMTAEGMPGGETFTVLIKACEALDECSDADAGSAVSSGCAKALIKMATIPKLQASMVAPVLKSIAQIVTKAHTVGVAAPAVCGNLFTQVRAAAGI